MDERMRQRKRRTRKRILRRRIQLATLFVVLIGLIGIVFLLKPRQPSENPDKHPQATISQEKIENTKKLIDSYYQEFLTANALTVTSSDLSFADWLYENYTLTPFEEPITDALLYEATGESTHVLSDRYQGLVSEANHIYERTGKTNGQAEITIAGDLCLAEDGFVLDYYDTVNDLEKCISPELLSIMNETDVFYINHEYAISDRGTPLEGKYYTFRAKPERMALLKEMGTDIVALANNHVYDYGEDALFDTTELLTENGIPYVGGGKNIKEAKRPVYFIVNGIKIGFVGASNAEKFRYTPQATETTGGILRAYDTTEYNEVIKKASKNCDYLIAYIHWGTEDSNYLNDLQQQMGREFLTSGADIVVGGHPHVLQGMEYVDGKPIVYSLGDFWFNSETKYTGLLQLQITLDGLKQMSFVPCLQTNLTTQYLDTAEKQEALYQFLEDLSINIDIDSEGIIKAR